MKIIAMIPARMGSQRLKQKNLKEINGIPLITHAIHKCKQAGCFNEIWVNSEHDTFGNIAQKENVLFHKRPEELANHQSTSEDFVFEFLTSHKCDYLFQVHSIAPLLRAKEVFDFVNYMTSHKDIDVLLSVVNEQIECVYHGEPINFSYRGKTNSQDLEPVQRVTWSITGWKSNVFINAVNNNKCATYSGKVQFFPISRMSGLIIKNIDDFNIAECLFNIIQ